MKKSIVWFWQDLRINDNPALAQAIHSGEVLCVYVYDSNEHIGCASKYWLYHSLQSLNQQLDNKLNIYCGEPLQVINDLVKKFNIENVFWNKCYQPYAIKRDNAIEQNLLKQKIQVKNYNASLLFEPTQITKDNGEFYKIFTPFYKKCIKSLAKIREPLSTNKKAYYIQDTDSLTLTDLELLAPNNWHDKFNRHWQIGAQYADKLLQEFIEYGLANYTQGRNYPALNNISKLSPYLHFGQISPQQILYKIQQLTQNQQTENFIRQLIWREFAYQQLYYQPEITHKNLRPKFDNFKWVTNDNMLRAWQQGKTGIPIVDAGMRELWQTGYMHNRVRMITASFLVKNLRIHWKHGEQWFWDCLVDADLAVNSASWQWVAGTGIDAAPYFRIFNPITQSKKFDKDGEYIRKYIPEIAKLPNKYLFAPHEAPQNILTQHNIDIGTTYLKPITDIKQSSKQALQYFKQLS